MLLGAIKPAAEIVDNDAFRSVRSWLTFAENNIDELKAGYKSAFGGGSNAAKDTLVRDIQEPIISAGNPTDANDINRWIKGLPFDRQVPTNR